MLDWSAPQWLVLGGAVAWWVEHLIVGMAGVGPDGGRVQPLAVLLWITGCWTATVGLTLSGHLWAASAVVWVLVVSAAPMGYAVRRRQLALGRAAQEHRAPQPEQRTARMQALVRLDHDAEASIEALTRQVERYERQRAQGAQV